MNSHSCEASLQFIWPVVRRSVLYLCKTSIAAHNFASSHVFRFNAGPTLLRRRQPAVSDPNHSKAHTDAWAHNARIGLILFVIYLILYGVFIVLSAFMRDTMKTPSIAGVNLAIVYGFGLIVGAFVLAVIYMVICKSEPDTRPELTEIEVANKAAEEEGAA
ncbi:DUF485 domain-containing protein [Humisphaera borealis]|uniref:DUF485 domain-containing protein n=1 Tax=Humisphaera borealis TaxID=2807512 RepID=A0A7M2WY77_9BACT|nr:DUF485 domain-containing protein [Humisphaera borealis]